MGLLCGILIVFSLWAIRDATCAWRRTLRREHDAIYARRHSTWRVVRIFECGIEAKGPGSVIWAEITLAKEVVETVLQILNVLDYASRGYTATALYIYLAVIALNIVRWWVLTLPRTIDTVRSILVSNALISAFYGFFALGYLFFDGVQGILMHRDSTFTYLSDLERQSVIIGVAQDAFFGGNFWAVVWKLLTRMLPLFVAVNSVQGLAGLGAYQHQYDDADDADHPPSSSLSSSSASSSVSPPTTDAQADAHDRPLKRQHSTFTRLTQRLTRSNKHPGLQKKVVLPIMAAVLAVVVGTTARLAVLSNGCKHEPGENNSEQRWVGRWCLRQAFPLLSTLPGSPSACACAVLFVTPPGYRSGMNTNQTECDPAALTRLHDDLVDDDLHIAKYLRNVMHHCPMQNLIQTEKILGSQMDAVTSISVKGTDRGGCSTAAATGGGPTPPGKTVGLPDLRAENLLWLEIRGVPLTIREGERTLKTCTKLAVLKLNVNHLTRCPTLEMNTVLTSLEIADNCVVQIPTLALEKNIALTRVVFTNNSLVQIPILEKNTALVELDLNSNRLVLIPSLDKNEALTSLKLGFNSLRELPNLEKNIALEMLFANDNRIVQIPSLEKNTKLANLDLQGNRLVQIPSLEKNTALNELRLNSNNLVQIPSLEKNTAITRLYFQDNRLVQIPSLEKNTLLQYLCLQNNNLVQIPSLEKNAALAHIFADNNHLTSSFWSSLEPTLTSLRVLSAAYNQLDHIPTWVPGLPKLVYLDLSGNLITSIGATNDASPANVNKVAHGNLGRNASLMLVGGNPVCETTTAMTGDGGGGGETPLVGSSRWNVQCQSQCSKACPMSIPWKTRKSYRSFVPSVLNNGICDVGCNTTACGYDGGKCLL